MEPKVLIVDDNLVNLKLACTLLECEKFQVFKATSAEEALRILDNSTLPDLILLDIGMPGMDGFTLTRKIKSDLRLKDLPVVALTASAMKGDDEKAYNAGFDGYLTKPINTRIFHTQVKQFIKNNNES